MRGRAEHAALSERGFLDECVLDTYGAHCTGMIDSTPDHRLTITSTVTLRLAVTSTTDSSLVVRGPGKVLCDDDSGGQLDAAVVDSFRPGEYEIYVGHLGQAGEYRLEISETR